jgi:hypothetical protein
MPPFDDPRRERCARNLARGMSHSRASRDAGYAGRASHAKERSENPRMSERIKEIKAEFARQGDPDLGPVIDALMTSATKAYEEKDVKMTPAGLVAVRGLLAEAARLKGLVPRTTIEDDDNMLPDLDDDAWMARFGPAAD